MKTLRRYIASEIFVATGLVILALVLLFAFFDVASLRLEEPLPGQDGSGRLRSAGAGLRFAGLGGLAAELDWARPLVDGANVLADEDRVHFRLSYGF